MIKHLWLLFVPFVTLAQEPIVKKELADADVFIARLYLSAPVEKFCREHPQEQYAASYRGVPVMVDCKTRNEWVRLHRRGEVKR